MVEYRKRVSPYFDGSTHTNEKGVPFVRPEKPADNTDIESKIEWMRQVATYNDAVTSQAYRGFVEGFENGLKGRVR